MARSSSKLPVMPSPFFVHCLVDNRIPRAFRIFKQNTVIPEFLKSSFVIQKGFSLEKISSSDFLVGKKGGELFRFRMRPKKKTKKKTL